MGVALLIHYTARQSEHNAAEKEVARRAGGTCARFGHSWIPARAAWRKCPSEHVPLPSPHETPASLSCFIQYRRRAVVDGTPASVVRALYYSTPYRLLR
jgi:hypothetical protein